MTSLPNPIKVAVVVGRHTSRPWHRLVIEAVRATPGVALIGAAMTDPPPGHADDTGVVPAASIIAEVPELRSTVDADVIVDLIGADVAGTPPLGVWRYGFGDGSVAAGGAKGTLARLYLLTPGRDHAIVLHEGWYRRRTSDGWGTRSVATRVAPWCARVLRQLSAGHDEQWQGPARYLDNACRLMEPPHADEGVWAPIVDTAREWLIRQRWSIGLVPLTIEQMLDEARMPEPTWLQGQRGDRFYADPFPVRRDGDRIRLLVEDYRYRSRRKLLTSLDVSADGHLLSERHERDLPDDASYPFLLRVGGALMCLPETFRARRLAAFRCEGDHAWSFSAELLQDFPVVDATLVEREGLWWLFCTKQGDEDQTDLYLFCASNWQGPWEPHPLNPVKSDTRSSRPAGACLTIDGVLYRPAQNCARRYGGGISINRIVHLSRTSFREEPVLELSPGPDSPWPHGLHTINSIGRTTIVDGLRIERRLRRS